MQRLYIYLAFKCTSWNIPGEGESRKAVRTLEILKCVSIYEHAFGYLNSGAKLHKKKQEVLSIIPNYNTTKGNETPCTNSNNNSK